MTGIPPQRLSKLLSHALRHEPWMYELELDEQGWVPIPELLAAVHEQGPAWAGVGRADLEHVIATGSKQRHEIDGDRIRARYGHSVPGRITLTEAEPPARLYHGTAPETWPAIRNAGLHPIRRQYVHLSADVETAQLVGARKAKAPVILTVSAARAHADGTRFWRGNDVVWLAESVPPAYLSADRPT